MIWDPFQAAAEIATGARTLADGTGLAPNHQFYLARQKFAEADPQVLDAIVAAVVDIDAWAKGREKSVAEELSAGIGIPAPVLEVALKRQTYGIEPLDASVVAAQQSVADTFFRLGLLPNPIVVSTIVRKSGS